MHVDLAECERCDELKQEEIPKLTTISNWIMGFSWKWKAAIVICSLEEAESSKTS